MPRVLGYYAIKVRVTLGQSCYLAPLFLPTSLWAPSNTQVLNKRSLSLTGSGLMRSDLPKALFTHTFPTIVLEGIEPKNAWEQASSCSKSEFQKH